MADQTIHDILFNIQQELKAPKSQYNDFAKFKYRSADAILTALKPILKKYKATIRLEDEVKNIGDSNYIQAQAILSDGLTELRVNAYAREEETKKGMDTAQITGSTSSYARKYALSGMFAIDDEKDPDSQDNRDHQTKPKASTNNGPASDKQRNYIRGLLEKQNVNKEDMPTYLHSEYNLEPGTVMSASLASQIIEDLQ